MNADKRRLKKQKQQLAGKKSRKICKGKSLSNCERLFFLVFDPR